MEWFHGGPSGLRGELLPPATTGVEGTRALLARRAPELEAAHARNDRVFLTNRFEVAAMFACVWPKPAVYVVEPIGGVEPDPDHHGPLCESVQTSRATIIRELHIPRPMTRAFRAALGQMAKKEGIVR
jgi:hypothetical protein